jgi:hypothetical protein
MQVQFKANEAGAERPASNPASTPGAAPVADGARPAWLPEKFKSAEELAIAYAHLETKIGAPKSEAPASTPPAKAEGEAKPEAKPEDKPAAKPEDKVASDLKDKGIDVDGMSQRFWETGDLAADDRTVLETELKKVFGDKASDLINDYVSGKKAELGAYEASVFGPLGGNKAAAEPILAWARGNGNLDEATRATINALWASDDVKNHTIASQKLAEAYTAKNGKAPAKTVEGGTTPVVSSDVYQSDAQMQADQRDPRYKTDPAFRRTVEDKVRRSLAR